MTRKLLAFAAKAAAVMPAMATAQEPPTSSMMEAIIVQSTAPDSRPHTVFVEQDTMVRLMVVNEVSTKVAKVGDRFVLRVDEDVVVNGVTIIPVGTKAWGEVLSAESSGVVGKSGKLEARLLYAEVNGDRIPLRGENRSAGASGTGETVMGVIGLGPFGLLARGNNAKLKAGEIFNGYFDRDMLFDQATSRLIAKPVDASPLIVSVAQ
ncbi:hypothetical protein [Allosphingosinicella humi]